VNVNNINKTNNYLSSQIIEHNNDHDTDVGNQVHGASTNMQKCVCVGGAGWGGGLNW
jgi:hypothetical protein